MTILSRREFKSGLLSAALLAASPVPRLRAPQPQTFADRTPQQTMEQTIEQAIAEFVVANRIVAHLGIVDAFGHVTVRHPQDPQRYFMPRSLAPGLVSRQDILEFRLDNSPVDLRGMRPYSERPIHGCIYQARPDVMAICHNHAHDLLPLAITKTPVRPVLHTASVIGREVPVWDIRDEFGDTNLLVTTYAMGDSLARTLGTGRAVLMRGHGSAVAGTSLRDVVFTAHYLRVNAELILKASALGAPIVYLSPGEVDKAMQFHSRADVQNRAWEQWVLEAGLQPTPAK